MHAVCCCYDRNRRRRLLDKWPDQPARVLLLHRDPVPRCRYGDWKFLFTEQDKWFNGVKNDLVTPLITNLKLDPFERFHDARGFDEWQENRSWTLAPAIGVVQQFFASFDEYPPRQASMEVNVDDIMHEMMEPNAR